MPSLVHFSAAQGDYVLVQEEPQSVADAMEAATSGLIKLTKISLRGERGVDPKPVWMNVARIAYVTAPADPSRIPSR